MISIFWKNQFQFFQKINFNFLDKSFSKKLKLIFNFLEKK